MRRLAANVAVVDAGNLLPSTNGVLEQLKADTALKALASIGYDAFNLGDKEFMFGADYLLDRIEANSLTAVSANILDNATGTTVAAPFVLKSFDGFTLGITGAMAAQYGAAVSDKESGLQLAITDETAALREQVTALKEAADIIIVLAATGIEGAIALARAIDGIDVIVAAHGSEVYETPIMINTTAIVKAGAYGEYVGRLDITLDAANEVNRVRGSITAIASRIPDDNESQGLIEYYHEQLKDHADEIFPAVLKAPAAGGSYAGAAACGSCHGAQHDQWELTAHAGAYDSLVARGQEYNPECVFCHVTGYGYEGGFQRPDLSPELYGVQCDMCHGPAGHHLTDSATPPPGLPDVSACMFCHTSEKSPHFDYATYKAKIVH